MRGIPRALAVAMLSVVGACSGAGGSPGRGSVAPFAAPTVTPLPSLTGPSTYAVISVPAGLTVSVANGTATQTLTTPATVVPLSSNVAFSLTIVPTDGAPLFNVTGDQRNDGLHTILYNQRADTMGSIGAIVPLALARRIDPQMAAQAAAREPRLRSNGSAGRAHASSTRLIVRYRAAILTSSGRRAQDVERSEGVVRARTIGFERNGLITRVVAVPDDVSIGAFAARMRAHPEVESAVPEALYYKQTTTPVIPNDTHFDTYQQWDMFAIKAPNAWGYTEGNSAGVSIAIIDTGADFLHEDLSGAKIVYAESVLDGVVTSGAAAAQDTDGHGTNVAGIAAADTDNAFGFAGTGFNVSLQVYKVFPDSNAANDYSPGANSSDVAQAIYDAVAQGARVINLSLGNCQAYGYDTVEQDAVDDALTHNVVVVAAAGNERSDGSSDPACQGVFSTIDFPAAYDGVISVGASKLDDSADPGNYATATEHVASYSNAGPGLSLVAPGGDPTAAEAQGGGIPDILHWVYNIYSTTAANPQAQCSNKSDCKALFAGTSQATPHVSGAAALLLSVNPNLTAPQIKTILLANADDIGDPLEGSGRLDVYRALAALTGDRHPPALPTNLNFIAFAYVPNGGTVPQILDVTYPFGVPVLTNGTFRIVDIPANAPAYKIGVWYDANGDGIVDAGDYFGSSQLCRPTAPCTSALEITVAPVASGFRLQ